MHRFAVCILLVFFLTENSAIHSISGDEFTKYRDLSHLPQDCGRTRLSDISTRIIGGTKAQLGEFPWMARIGIREADKEDWFFCGGSLINRYYVVSAAHCEEIGNIVRLGENDIDTPIDCNMFGECAPPHQDIRIREYKFANYCRTIADNDLMLIELEEPAIFNAFVQPICLPTVMVSVEDLVNEYLVLSGWGSENGSNPLQGSRNLLYISVPVIDFQTCKQTFSDTVQNHQICMGRSADGRNVCSGDSGGSAAKRVRVDGVNRMYLFGIASYVQANCQGGAIYTHVPYYLDFILDRIKKS